MEESSGYLFSTYELREVVEQRRSSLRQEIEQIEANRFLNTSPADLTRYFIDKYTFNSPVLRRDMWTVSEHETQIDVSNDSERLIFDRSRPFLIPGQHIEIDVPFDGDAQLLYARASTSSSMPPRAVVQGQSIVLTFDIRSDAPPRNVKAEAEAMLDDIERHLSWTRSDLSGFNQPLTAEVQAAITKRRERILANQGRVASLGIPVKGRPDIPCTYALPEVRRKIVPVLPPSTSAAYVPEPALDMEIYEHILNVMQNMAQVMERSPSAFKSMKEEDLRQHFLVQLNGQFEGAATGETFNVAGKTDILLRYQGRNVFIAECKFWKGPKEYGKAITQLLEYKAWRDTKTAILIFNRETAMSTVLSGVNSESEEHANFKLRVDWKHESGFRYVFHHTGDSNREFLLTVIVFDVPSSADHED
jgi:hypothetical protein